MGSEAERAHPQLPGRLPEPMAGPIAELDAGVQDLQVSPPQERSLTLPVRDPPHHHIIFSRHRHTSDVSEACFWIAAVSAAGDEKDDFESDGTDYNDQGPGRKRSAQKDPWQDGNDPWSPNFAQSGHSGCNSSSFGAESKKPRTAPKELPADCCLDAADISKESTMIFNIAIDDDADDAELSDSWGSSLHVEDLAKTSIAVQTPDTIPPDLDMQVLCQPSDLLQAAFHNGIFSVTRQFAALEKALQECANIEEIPAMDGYSHANMQVDVDDQLLEMVRPLIQTCVNKCIEFEFACAEAAELLEVTQMEDFVVHGNLYTLPEKEEDCERCLCYTNASRYLNQMEILNHIVLFCANCADIQYAEARDALADHFCTLRIERSYATQVLEEMEFKSNSSMSITKFVQLYCS